MLHRIFSQRRHGHDGWASWAVQLDPDPVDRALWKRNNVSIQPVELRSYLERAAGRPRNRRSVALTDVPPRAARSPFPGLAAFTASEEDAAVFAGRDAESELVAANLRTASLTILYGPSGVGKSSLLRAGVVRRIQRPARRGRGARVPAPTVIVHDEWAGDAAAALARRVTGALGNGAGDDAPRARRRARALGGAATRAAARDLRPVRGVPAPARRGRRRRVRRAVRSERTSRGPARALPRVAARRRARRSRPLPGPHAGPVRQLPAAGAHGPAARSRRRRGADRVRQRLATRGGHRARRDRARPRRRDLRRPQRPDAAVRRARCRAPRGGPRPIELAFLQLVMRRLWEADATGAAPVLRRSTLHRARWDREHRRGTSRRARWTR